MVYGFESFFLKGTKFRDIDLLIIHDTVKYDSCLFAIFCKHYILKSLTKADITILSTQEEQRISFIIKSSASYLGTVKEESKNEDLNRILHKVNGEFVTYGTNCETNPNYGLKKKRTRKYEKDISQAYRPLTGVSCSC